VKVLLLTRYGRRGASSRLRAYQYLPYLESQGIQITTAPLLTDDYLSELYEGRVPRRGPIVRSYVTRLRHLLQAKARFDLLWIEYELFPWLPALAERWLAARGIRYVVDYDDAIFHRYGLHRNRLVRLALGKKIDVVMRGAETVIAGNRYLNEYARAAGAARVEQIPTGVDLTRYRLGGGSRDDRAFTVGWIGSPSTVRYLAIAAPALGALHHEGSIRVVVVGVHNAGLDGIPVLTRPWSEDTEASDLEGFDVGIMPLPDEPWERGKCGYKLLQYMSASLPVVASPVGVNSEIVENGVTGFLAATPDQWVEAIQTLRRNPVLRRQLGEAGRKKVERLYSSHILGPKLSDVLTMAHSRARDG